MKRCKSLINTLKGIGSSIDPRGIPTIVSNDSLKDEPTFTLFLFSSGKGSFVLFFNFTTLGKRQKRREYAESIMAKQFSSHEFLQGGFSYKCMKKWEFLSVTKCSLILVGKWHLMFPI